LAGHSVTANLFAFKLLPVLFFFASLPVVYRLAERIRAGSGVGAIVFFGWNPLVVLSVAIDGHNDMIMVFFMLVAFHEMLYGRWETSMVSLALATLAKYVAVLMLPLLLAYAWKQEGRAAASKVVAGGATSLVIAFALWYPFWEGPGTLRGVLDHTDRVIHSPFAAIIFAYDPWRTSLGGAPPLLAALFTGAFLAVVGIITLRFLRLPHGGFVHVVEAGIAVLVAYLAIKSWWFFPWYVVWLLPLAAVLARGHAAILAVVLSASAMALFVPFGWGTTPGLFEDHMTDYSVSTALLVWGPPLFYLAAGKFQSIRGLARPLFTPGGGHTAYGRRQARTGPSQSRNTAAK
jgi:hypothetical protein